MQSYTFGLLNKMRIHSYIQLNDILMSGIINFIEEKQVMK